jgi:apolipoprotein N-acyltransferase
MAKRRHALNPAKVKADARALEAPAPLRPVGWWLRADRRPTNVLLGALTLALLTVSFAPWDGWPLAYVALVPWTLGLLCGPSRRWALLWGWLTGLVFWGLSLYWLTWITLLGWAAGVLYLSAYWWISAVVLRAALRRRWPLWLVLPIVWVALEYVRAHVIDFPWFYLAHTQYTRTALIQIADVVGQYGVSFFVAMVNGLVADLLAGGLIFRADPPGTRKRRLVRGAIATGLAAAVLLGYGAWQLHRDTRSEGPVIAIVQDAQPIALGPRDDRLSPEQIFDKHVAVTRTFVGREVDLVLWAETMLPRGVNDEVTRVDVQALSGDDLRALAAKFLGPAVWEGHPDEIIRAYLQPLIEGGAMPDGERVVGRREYAARVRQLGRRLRCPILAGGATIHRNDDSLDAADRWVVRNGAVWFDPRETAAATYAKMHLVPFSESVPFKQSWPWLHRRLRRLVPAVMEQLDPGRSVTRFELRPRGAASTTAPGARRRWTLVSPICYEGTFDRVCRRMVYEGGRKRADLIANLSNDGWFVYGDAGSTEHAQHLSHYCFRAVENRVPVVRAVNTGISASIDSNGRIATEIAHAGKRTMVAGTLLLDGARRNPREYLLGHGPKVLVDRRTSWYSRGGGDVFAWAVVLVALALVIRLAWKRPKSIEGANN